MYINGNVSITKNVDITNNINIYHISDTYNDLNKTSNDVNIYTNNLNVVDKIITYNINNELVKTSLLI